MVKKHNDEYDYDFYEPEMRINEGVTEYHFYNPLDDTDLGWISENDIYNDLDAFKSRYTVPAGTRIEREIDDSYFVIPSSIEADLSTTKGKVASLYANFSHTSTQKGVFDLAKDKISAEFGLSAADYTLSINKLDFLSTAGEIGCSFSYKGHDIIRLNITETGASLKEKVRENHYETDPVDGVKYYTDRRRVYYDYGYDAINIPTAATVDADILGQIQIKGQANIDRIMAAIEDMENIKDDASAKAWAKKVEQYFNLDVYFDNSKNCSASLGIEVINKGEEYKAVPVIRYPDETEYTFVSDFFTLSNFAETLAAVLKWYGKAQEFIPSFSLAE
jgi:hypothetical protein